MKKTLFVLVLAVMALMLVSTTSFAKVTGTCSTCHTMHMSQNNDVLGSTDNMGSLTLGQCVFCHGSGGAKDVTIDQGRAGAFDQAAESANVHNVTDLSWTNAENDNTASPGGQTQETSTFTCASCHSFSAGQGHHQGVDYILGSSSTITKNHYTYGTGGVSEFCNTCHGTFHGTGNQGDSATGYTRHPTDVAIPTSWTLGTDTSIIGIAYADDAAADAGTDGQVTCTSCHRAHGSANADLLRFAMSSAGSTAETGCLHCHEVQRN